MPLAAVPPRALLLSAQEADNGIHVDTLSSSKVQAKPPKCSSRAGPARCVQTEAAQPQLLSTVHCEPAFPLRCRAPVTLFLHARRPAGSYTRCTGLQRSPARSVQDRDRLSRAEHLHAAQPRDKSKGEATTPCSYKDERQTAGRTTLKPAPSLSPAPKAANSGLGGRCATGARGCAARGRAPLLQGTRRMWVCDKVQPSAEHRARC